MLLGLEFPSLSAPIFKKQNVATNFAAALAKPALKVNLPSISSASIASASISSTASAKTDAKLAPWSSAPFKTSNVNWAAWDSESEDETENEYEEAPYKTLYQTHSDEEEECKSTHYALEITVQTHAVMAPFV